MQYKIYNSEKKMIIKYPDKSILKPIVLTQFSGMNKLFNVLIVLFQHKHFFYWPCSRLLLRHAIQS